MTNKVLIRYGDVAIGAMENFNPSSEDKTDFANFHQLKRNIDFPKYTDPCELYSTPLDDSCLPIPDDLSDKNIGWWSEQISQNDGYFLEPIIMTAVAKNGLYSSIGITLVFDEENNTYANRISIEWYRDDALISKKDFNPNSSNYFCQNRVDYYNKIIVTFYSLNMPQNRLKLHKIEYGYGAEFLGNELKSVKVIQEISPISDEISINTVDFDLHSERDIEFSFQDRQSVETYFNGVLRAKTFIKDFKRKSKTQWSISTEDYIGLMETTPFLGGIYENESATAMLENIFNTAKIPFTIQDGAFDGIALSGHIPLTNCREALMQVAFAIGAVVDTSNREDVYIYSLSEEISQEIPLARIMQGQTFSNETKITALELTAHQFREIDEQMVLYDAEKSGSGENIFVKFAEPMHNLIIENGEIVENNYGANYALINASEGCVLSGKKYEHNQSIKKKVNPLVLITDTENIVSIKDATLVSSNNVDSLLEKCYNYIVQRKSAKMKIVERKIVKHGKSIKYGQKKYGSFKYGERTESSVICDTPVNVGDKISAKTEYLGDFVGRVISQSFNLNGGIIVKDTVVR